MPNWNIVILRSISTITNNYWTHLNSGQCLPLQLNKTWIRMKLPKYYRVTRNNSCNIIRGFLFLIAYAAHINIITRTVMMRVTMLSFIYWPSIRLRIPSSRRGSRRDRLLGWGETIERNRGCYNIMCFWMIKLTNFVLNLPKVFQNQKRLDLIH